MKNPVLSYGQETLNARWVFFVGCLHSTISTEDVNITVGGSV